MRALLCIATLFVASPVLSQALALVVFAVGDRAHIQNGQVFDLQPQDIIRKGETIQTGNDGKVSVQCSTGVIFQIGNNTSISLDDLVVSNQGSSLIVHLSNGSLATIVAKSTGTNNVSIQTPSAVASVRGTEFVVEADDAETNVLVNEGEVQVEDPSGGKAQVRPGRFVRARLREKLAEAAADESHKKRLRVLEEFRNKRDGQFRDRIEKLRNQKERIKTRREQIRRKIKEIREEKREDRKKRQGDQ